jgi:hypothetical protein
VIPSQIRIRLRHNSDPHHWCNERVASVHA